MNDSRSINFQFFNNLEEIFYVFAALVTKSNIETKSNLGRYLMDLFSTGRAKETSYLLM